MRPSGDYDGDMTFVCFWLALVNFLRLTAEFVDGLPWKDIGLRHCSVSLSLRRHLTPPRRRISAGRLCPNWIALRRRGSNTSLSRIAAPRLTYGDMFHSAKKPDLRPLVDVCPCCRGHEYLNFARTCLAKGAAGKVDGLSQRATLRALRQPHDEEALNAALVFSVLAHNVAWPLFRKIHS